MQPDLDPKRIATAAPVRLSSAPPHIPSRSEAIEFPWRSSIARARGLHGFNSMDSRSRSFNLVRAKIATLNRERGWRMIGFVSATPDVGKSFVAANVAAAMSRDPRWSTYLVDLDLRRGGVASIFGVEPDRGLEEYLASPLGAATLPACAPEGQELIIIPTVPGQLPSAELLAADTATALFQEMRRSDDQKLFFFDLPPVFANDDTLTVADQLDGYVLVAEEGKTTRRELESAVDMLGQERLAGVILNKYRGGLVSEGRGSEQRYAAGYYAGAETVSSSEEQSPPGT